MSTLRGKRVSAKRLLPWAFQDDAAGAETKEDLERQHREFKKRMGIK
jgi:hypothetical protein